MLNRKLKCWKRSDWAIERKKDGRVKQQKSQHVTAYQNSSHITRHQEVYMYVKNYAYFLTYPPAHLTNYLPN
jgi:hypothetical protein